MRVLFVDDEPRVLSGIENGLLFADLDWQADFATSGEQAVDLVAGTGYDVVVTDMKMPGLNGADVLEHLMANHPNIVRVILSGEVDRDLAERAMPLAHEFVSKPCDPDSLLAIIGRVHEASRGLGNLVIPGLVGTLDHLPAQPELFAEVRNAVEKQCDTSTIARLIETDLAVMSMVVKTANSAFYGFADPARNVDAAVARLGLQTVTGVVLNAELTRTVMPGMERSMIDLNLHSIKVADLVRRLIGDESGEAGLAGLVHDVGRLALMVHAGGRYRSLDRFYETKPGVEEAEREIFGMSHAEAGAFMLELWHFAPVVVESVRYHHRSPGHAVRPEVRRINDAVTAAHIALYPHYHPPDVTDPDLIGRARELVRQRAGQGEAS